jgi:capsular exopolysaccharide synthesis family protein
MPVRERQSLALVAHVRPNSQMAEAYRALRTSLLLSSPGHPPKAIVISSALPQEGKSTTSVNTAVVLAQMGSKVLLVDADLRRPSLHHLLRLRNSAGLSTLLASGGDYHSLIATHPEMSNLDILPAGPPPPHPAELLSSNYFQRYLNEWREQYQHIIIDTPPMLSVTDGVIASVYADAVVLVVRSGRTTKNALRQLRSMLTQVNTHVVGILINGVDLNSPTSYYYYAYSYARTHGHYYGDESNETSAARTTASNGQ